MDALGGSGICSGKDELRSTRSCFLYESKIITYTLSAPMGRFVRAAWRVLHRRHREFDASPSDGFPSAFIAPPDFPLNLQEGNQHPHHHVELHRGGSDPRSKLRRPHTWPNTANAIQFGAYSTCFPLGVPVRRLSWSLFFRSRSCSDLFIRFLSPSDHLGQRSDHGRRRFISPRWTWRDAVS